MTTIRSIGLISLALVLGACGGRVTSAENGAGTGGASGSGGAIGSGGVIGSGGSSGAPSGSGGPCGGDLTGSWSLQKVSGSVVVPGIQIGGCTDATATITYGPVSGAYIFHGKGLEQSVSATHVATISAPSGCVSASDCVSFEEQILETQAPLAVPLDRCTFQNSCKCRGTSDYTILGTYQVNGTSVTINQQTYGYCVSGNTLTLFDNNNGSNATLVFTSPAPTG